ncbi:hypothetical protein Agabi119p4_4483 [Agaricus bisporus var. burnettii]|uniref:Large ribosomal subunit protein uL11m n=1 Tax=Agaricus bisporus var. burnettii TaxID=192524 RepID=A0A8H7F376_AGABI|nr:hypothetical protein Agabi119p4_4483 [Agaricus bisporus var. burnettii]
MSKAAAKARAQIVRLLIPAGKAAPAPPVGPALGARGVRSADFCKEFNARTAHIEPGVPTPTLITVQPDRSFSFVTRTPPVSYFLKKAAGIEKGPARPGHEVTGTVSLKHVSSYKDDHRQRKESRDPSGSVIVYSLKDLILSYTIGLAAPVLRPAVEDVIAS